MKFKEIQKKSLLRLKANIFKALGLFIFDLIALICMVFVRQALFMFFNGTLFNTNFFIDNRFNSVIANVAALIISVIVFVPFRMGVLRWYTKLGDFNPPFTDAFFYFNSLKDYIICVWYAIIKMLASFLTHFVLFIPAFTLMAILKLMLNNQIIKNEFSDIMFACLFIIMVLFLLLGAFYSIFFTISFFLSNYIFINEIAKNPFKAIALSFKLTRYKKSKFLLFVLSLLPYFLLCFLVFPIIFIFPYIKTAFAVYAQTELKIYQNSNNK